MITRYSDLQNDTSYPTTQFTNPNQTPSMTVTDTTYIAALTIPSDPIEANADFVITLENNQSVTLSVTENDFPKHICGYDSTYNRA